MTQSWGENYTISTKWISITKKVSLSVDNGRKLDPLKLCIVTDSITWFDPSIFHRLIGNLSHHSLQHLYFAMRRYRYAPPYNEAMIVRVYILLLFPLLKIMPAIVWNWHTNWNYLRHALNYRFIIVTEVRTQHTENIKWTIFLWNSLISNIVPQSIDDYLKIHKSQWTYFLSLFQYTPLNQIALWQ